MVKKEIITWLDAVIIYPISDSQSVSPLQCVRNKGGMAVVGKEKMNKFQLELCGKCAWIIEI